MSRLGSIFFASVKSASAASQSPSLARFSASAATRGARVLRASESGSILSELRLPTGDANELLGSGAIGVKPFVVAGHSFGRLSAHINLGYTFENAASSFAREAARSSIGSGESLNYTAGTVLAATQRLTLSADMLGRRLTGVTKDVAIGKNETSLVVGGKFYVGRTFLLSVNAVIPLSSPGLAPRVSPLIGFEYGF